jgi:hypothetical protein
MSVHGDDFTACTDTEWLNECELTEEIAQIAVDVCGVAVSSSNDARYLYFQANSLEALNQRIDSVYYISGTTLAIRESLSFTVRAATDCVQSLQHSNVAQLKKGFHV